MKVMLSLFALALSSAALASSTLKATPGQYVLRNADGTPVAGLTVYRFASEQECFDAAKLQKSGKYKCDHSVGVLITATCADEPAPPIYLVQVEHEGGMYWQLPEEGAFAPPEPSDANGWSVMRWLYVHNPQWPDGYPNCWVRGWVPEQLWRFNPNYPGTPKLELIVPGMAEVSELPNDMTPAT